MNKDEMKNRISLALKDPILQQGFEIICKENAELKEYNKYLRRKRQGGIQKQYNKVAIIKRQDEQLTKAKELLKDITSSYGSTEVSEAQSYLKIKKAEQFLKELENV